MIGFADTRAGMFVLSTLLAVVLSSCDDGGTTEARDGAANGEGSKNGSNDASGADGDAALMDSSVADMDANTSRDAMLPPLDGSAGSDRAPIDSGAGADAASDAEVDGAMADAGVDSGSACATSCPSTGGAAVASGISLVFKSIDWVNDIVVLKNLGVATFDLSNGDLCQPFDYAAFPAGTSISPGGELTVHLTTSGATSASEVFLNAPSLNLSSDDELVLFKVASGHTNANIEAYVRWGVAAPNNRQSQAVGVGLWLSGDTVEVCEDHGAIVAVDETTSASGFESAPSTCH
jgi:hypothetical protein